MTINSPWWGGMGASLYPLSAGRPEAKNSLLKKDGNLNEYCV